MSKVDALQDVSKSERRFLDNLDITIGIAEKKNMVLDEFTGELLYSEEEVLIATFNLVSYFCEVMERGDNPGIRLIKFIIDLLVRTMPKSHIKIELRNEKIKRCINNRRKDKNIRQGILRCATNEKLSFSHVNKIYYSKTPVIVKLINDFENENYLCNEDLICVLPNILEIHSNLFAPTKEGQDLRYFLKLKGSRWWEKKDALYHEICLEMNILIKKRYSLKTILWKISIKNYGINSEQIEKIYKNLKQDIKKNRYRYKNYGSL